MSIVKSISQLVITVFFKVFFTIFGEPKIPKYVSKAMEKYQGGQFSQLFQLIRIWDAPFEELDSYIPNSKVIIDLGCGDGLLANALALSRKKSQVWGIDINRDRIAEAKKGITNTHFFAGDIMKKAIPKANVILLVHVLHHLPSKADQEKLLRQCISKLQKNGKLIIVEIQEEPILKYALTWLVDAFVVPVLFQKRLYDFKFWYRSKKDWKDLLKANNLKVKTINASKNKPFSHVIFIASRS